MVFALRKPEVLNAPPVNVSVNVSTMADLDTTMLLMPLPTVTIESTPAAVFSASLASTSSVVVAAPVLAVLASP